MRILLIQESSWIDRGPHQQHHLMERLQEKGHTIRVIDFDIDWKDKTKAGFYQKRSVYQAQGKSSLQAIKVIRPAMIRIPILVYFFVTIFHFIEILRQTISYKPDIVVGFGVLSTYLATRICRFSGIPFVFYLIDSLHNLIPEIHLRYLGKTLERSIVRRANQVVVINKSLADYALRLGLTSNPEIITAGIDVSRFHPNIDGSFVRSKHGYTKSDFVLFFMGWIYEFSGVVEVAEKLSKEISELHLLVLGKGDMFTRIEDISRNCSNVQIVEWVPYEMVPQYIASSNICILPAFRNDIMNSIVPIKMYEYLGCGIPVISTSLPGIMKEFGVNSGVIYAHQPEDTLDIAVSLKNNQKLYENLQHDAIKGTSELSWDKITDSFESLLIKCIANDK